MPEPVPICGSAGNAARDTYRPDNACVLLLACGYSAGRRWFGAGGFHCWSLNLPISGRQPENCRRHSALDYETPAAFAARSVQQASATLRPVEQNVLPEPRFSH